MSNKDDFLILHGTGGNAPGHWQDFLAKQLRAGGKNVCYPRLPGAGTPLLDNWMPALEKELDGIDGACRLTVVAHSRSCILWMHYAAQHADTAPKFVFCWLRLLTLLKSLRGPDCFSQRHCRLGVSQMSARRPGLSRRMTTSSRLLKRPSNTQADWTCPFLN